MGRDELSFEGGATLGNRVVCTRHYEQRFAERVSRKSKRWEIFAERAYEFGEGRENIADKRLRNYIEAKERRYGSSARVYHGYIYWFVGQIATTVYLIPKVLEGAIC